MTDDAWNDAVQRATTATAAGPGGIDESCWDAVAMRNIVAIVLYALHHRDQQPVATIAWPSVLWQLYNDERVADLVTTVMPRAGHDLTPKASPADPVTECWQWLTRTWDPHPAPPERRWDGMSRGIAGMPDPALEVSTPWAAGIVEQAIIAGSGGYRTHDRVEITSGPLEGHRGYVCEIGWHFNSTTQQADGPAGYVVDLDDVEGTEDIDADQVAACTDLRWAHRPEGSLKAGPPPGLNDPPTPAKTCEEDLQDLLDRAVNPQIVPETLRDAIAGGFHHFHLQHDWKATPSPRRLTWLVVQHWYQLTEHYADDQRAELYESVITQHLHDDEPAHYLALNADDLPALIAEWTTGS